MTKGSGTRSGLLWEVERLLNEVDNLPQVLVMENVPQVHSKANMPDFQKWIDFLTSKGYSNYWKDLNAKNYGVAQNRNRCFMVSILGDYTYEFPQEIPLTKVMKDYLEDEVDRKYYITTEKAQTLINKLILEGKINLNNDLFNKPKAVAHIGVGGQKGWIFDENGLCPCEPATQYKDASKVILCHPITE